METAVHCAVREGYSGTFHELLGKEKEEIRESVGEKWQRLRKG